MKTQNNILTASDNNKYVTLLKYAIHFNIDLSMFLTLWAVLSILIDTQDGNHEYVNFYRKNTTHTMQTDQENT